ncbi:Glycosyltransferase involved in cell wall bisynthesis [Mesonia phycicola]|uniref:Glycosyltransferase involved in cell wall bisynthesis n=1 Tax=Mesonia phycicola TaxID=579105 RepID=A0A1M6ALP2_9FLAO|nr:glycosyltransferase [Mesonia phycicola]SHI37375.1 Glycosyltransferase involved in cell wall bisynthesis [Mesonia phycicola]
MKLAIISHTEHYKTKDGEIVGWGPTITEINHLVSRFDKIYHVAFFHDEEAPPSSISYNSEKIEFIALPPSGGKTIKEKLTVVTNLPKTLKIIKEVLNKVDAFQFRAPVGIGVYLIPYLTQRVTKTGWFKYAGNWSQENPPLGYKLQRKFLINQHRKVTINGKWPNQPAHCLTFENPCLTLEERKEGIQIIDSKNYQPKYTFCFVGRLEDEKGVQRIIDAFSTVDNHKFVNHIHFIGNGEKIEAYKEQVNQHKIPATFHGFLSRTEVFNIYKKASFLLLPSTASEGFPKVIAEAMNYGCIPIVSNVSSIGQYINTENGFIVNPTTSVKLISILKELEEINHEILKEKAIKAYQVSESFTFENYNHRICTEILALN